MATPMVLGIQGRLPHVFRDRPLRPTSIIEAFVLWSPWRGGFMLAFRLRIAGASRFPWSTHKRIYIVHRQTGACKRPQEGFWVEHSLDARSVVLVSISKMTVGRAPRLPPAWPLRQQGSGWRLPARSSVLARCFHFAGSRETWFWPGACWRIGRIGAVGHAPVEDVCRPVVPRLVSHIRDSGCPPERIPIIPRPFRI